MGSRAADHAGGHGWRNVTSHSSVNMADAVLLVWALLFWFVQADSPTLCEDSSVVWFMTVYAVMTAVVVVGNWPFDRRRSAAEVEEPQPAQVP